MLFVGFHAPAGMDSGVLNHTYISPKDFFETRINGEAVGEAKIAAALAGALRVPVGLITGDDVTCGEMKSWAPDVETAVVKYAIDRQAARCLPIGKAQRLIREAAERAVKRAGEFKPFSFSKPTTVEVQLTNTSAAARIAAIPGVERTGDRLVSYTSDDFLDLYQVYVTMALQARYSADPAYAT